MKVINGNPLDWLDQKRLVGVVSVVTCSRCKHDYTPDDSDISRNGNLYCKLCKKCRFYCLKAKNKGIKQRLLPLLPANE